MAKIIPLPPSDRPQVDPELAALAQIYATSQLAEIAEQMKQAGFQCRITVELDDDQQTLVGGVLDLFRFAETDIARAALAHESADRAFAHLLGQEERRIGRIQLGRDRALTFLHGPAVDDHSMQQIHHALAAAGLAIDSKASGEPARPARSGRAAARPAHITKPKGVRAAPSRAARHAVDPDGDQDSVSASPYAGARRRRSQATASHQRATGARIVTDLDECGDSHGGQSLWQKDSKGLSEASR